MQRVGPNLVLLAVLAAQLPWLTCHGDCHDAYTPLLALVDHHGQECECSAHEEGGDHDHGVGDHGVGDHAIVFHALTSPDAPASLQAPAPATLLACDVPLTAPVAPWALPIGSGPGEARAPPGSAVDGTTVRLLL